MSARSLFVTGTDTGVGKTLVAAALLSAFAQRGRRAVGMKPVASGSHITEKGLRNEDALALMAQANVAAPYALVNPYCFAPPIAPHLAAAEAGVAVELKVLCDAHAQLAAQADIVVIEGAGGWLTPLNPRQTLADFAQAIAADVVLIVGLRLGCINHALLSAQSIAAAGLTLAGWIANTIEPQMQRLDENVQALQQRLPAPLLGVIPRRSNTDPAQIANELSLPVS